MVPFAPKTPSLLLLEGAISAGWAGQSRNLLFIFTASVPNFPPFDSCPDPGPSSAEVSSDHRQFLPSSLILPAWKALVLGQFVPPPLPCARPFPSLLAAGSKSPEANRQTTTTLLHQPPAVIPPIPCASLSASTSGRRCACSETLGGQEPRQHHHSTTN